MHFCPDCGDRCWCDGLRGINAEGAKTCVHCCGAVKTSAPDVGDEAESLRSEADRYLRAQAVGHRKGRP